MKFRVRLNIDWRQFAIIFFAVIAYLMLVATITRAAEPPKFIITNKVPQSFKVTNKVPAAPAVAAQPPFTQGGTRTLARHVGGLSTASTGTYRADDIPIGVPTTAPYGVIRGCVSYG